jgi:dTDP-4-dehydrorhamnose reductase
VKIVILGSTGMLGNAVGHSFLDKYGEDDVFLSYRNSTLSYGKNKFYFDCLSHAFDNIPSCDVIINCIGVIKPFIKKDPVKAIKINALFPHQLSDFCKQNHIKLIHITTDCVFSGKDGEYTEESIHDCLDHYGRTKSLGEPIDAMVLRTSIIGEELHQHVSLIAWAKSQAGKVVNGFNNHYWNGVTTKQYAKICHMILARDIYQTGTYHIFSNSITKYQLIHLLNNKFGLSLDIKNVAAPESIDRTLSTIFPLNKYLNIPNIEQQISDL